MLLSRKFKLGFLLLFCGLMLGACGFKPLYTTDSAVAGDDGLVPFHEIFISNIGGRSGQYLRNQLIDALYTEGRPAAPRYELKIRNLSENITLLGIQKDATATRAQMRINANLQLIDNDQDGKVVLQRSLRATNSFNILDSQYTTQVSRRYARERTLDEVSRLAVRQLSLYFNRPDVTHEAQLSAD